MRKLLLLIGVAVVAGAMYVAAASGSQQAKAPTAKQFNALKKQVATLSKTLKQVKTEANAAVTIIGACYLTAGTSATFMVLPVSQFGNTSSGFLFGTGVSTPPGTPRSALDVNTTGSPLAYLQEVDPTCATNGGLSHAATRSGRSRLLNWAERTR